MRIRAWRISESSKTDLLRPVYIPRVRTALSIGLFLALLAFALAHVSLVVAIARRERPARAALAFVVPPLAPFWGYELGFRRRAQAWLGALASYLIFLIGLSA